MLSIGRGPRLLDQAEEPGEMLSACHERIRQFSEIAIQLANGSDAPPQHIVDAATRLDRYFSVALPLHERDEEDSLAPRLLESPSRLEVADALARMRDEHRAIDAILATALPIWREVAASPEGLRNVAEELGEYARSLATLFEPHLAVEESTIFPAMMRSLSGATRRTILQEIRARRTPDVRSAMAAVMR
jgi:iron-sulfur cluster repair protein YtfE (RIC family)